MSACSVSAVTGNVSPDGCTSSFESCLVARAQEGDRQAFAALFDLHKSRVYALCFSITKNAAESERLTRDIFMTQNL